MPLTVFTNPLASLSHATMTCLLNLPSTLDLDDFQMEQMWYSHSHLVFVFVSISRHLCLCLYLTASLSLIYVSLVFRDFGHLCWRFEIISPIKQGKNVFSPIGIYFNISNPKLFILGFLFGWNTFIPYFSLLCFLFLNFFNFCLLYLVEINLSLIYALLYL